jgi:plasmid stability protein
MANLTITIDDEVLKRARSRALEQGTSVNALLRAYLEAFANPRELHAARAQLAHLARNAQSGSGPGGRRWTRDEIHERSS